MTVYEILSFFITMFHAGQQTIIKTRQGL